MGGVYSSDWIDTVCHIHGHKLVVLWRPLCRIFIRSVEQFKPYRWLYVISLVVGAVVQLEFVWNFSDITLGLMALPNLIALVALSGVVISLTKDYFSRNHIRTN